jgi:hypothetical protein
MNSFMQCLERALQLYMNPFMQCLERAHYKNFLEESDCEWLWSAILSLSPKFNNPLSIYLGCGGELGRIQTWKKNIISGDLVRVLYSVNH